MVLELGLFASNLYSKLSFLYEFVCLVEQIMYIGKVKKVFLLE